MAFLRKLFGGKQEGSKESNHDPDGIYFYAECNRCHTCVRVRADRRHDLNDVDGGFVWHKTIVDSRCFQRMQTVVRFDRSYNVVNAEIDGGRFVTEVDYQAFLEKRAQPAPASDAPTSEPMGLTGEAETGDLSPEEN